ncbi:ATP-dependent nuclease [Tenacibaculum sp. IMCC1]|uniref:Endonuclease GajA/Old nuclease/RecF-like AAA domain-containing protein n=1 Tax=Tenacibaculum sp. Pbs-1 TaxID=3238748 RepID=A0AB33KV91_9FLAO
MKIVKSIRIKYFRSILHTVKGGRTTIKTSDINVIVGENDAGKSNYLRALNLFFNNKCDTNQDFDFWKDFSIQRHKKKKERSRIEIELIISPPSKQSFLNHGDVKWTKIWYENSLIPDEKFEYLNGQKFTANYKSSYYKWLKKIKFRYVPAIKSKEYFDNLMFDLYDVLQKDTNQLETDFNTQVKEKTLPITNQINKRLNLDSILQFRGSFRDLFNTLEFGSNDGKLMLNQRGDGIKVRHIPIILQNIAEAELELTEDKKREPSSSTIWGFEEPENNLEFHSAERLSNAFLEYCKKIGHKEDLLHPHDEGIQIFITTHSPIFYTLEDKDNHSVNTFYVKKESDNNSEIKLIPKDKNSRVELENMMNLTPLVSLSSKWIDIKNELDLKNQKLLTLEENIKKLTKPVLITEGKTDTIILKTAWKKLYEDLEIPFDIIPGDTSPENENNGGNAGASVLSHFAKSVRETDNIKIVLWDYDKEGIKGFKLDKNFEIHNDLKYVKVHKNNRSFGLILPNQEGLNDFYEAENLPIEFYFDIEYLNLRDENNKGIILEKEKMVKTFGNKIVERELEEQYFCKVKGDKMAFANNIVPTLSKDSFNRFKKVFETIVIDILEKNNYFLEEPQLN